MKGTKSLPFEIHRLRDSFVLCSKMLNSNVVPSEMQIRSKLL